MNKVLLLSVFLSSALLICSAQDSDSSVLNGNWHLTGGPEFSQFPSLDITLGGDGTTIYGEGHLQVECPKDKVGRDIFVIGKVAADGTFELVRNPSRSQDKVTIQGSVPSQGSREWHGHFSVNLKSHDDACLPAQGDIVAEPFPALNGVYSGVLNVSDGSKTQVSLEIAQGQLISSTSFEPFSHCVSLNAKLTISDSASFPAGVFTTDGNVLPNNCNSRMSGNRFEQEFTLPDGSTMGLYGHYRYADPDRLDINLRHLPKDPKEQSNVLHAAARLSRR